MDDKPVEFTAQMPEYLSHKKVRALKIKEIVKRPCTISISATGFVYELVFEDKDYPNFEVTWQWLQRSHCKVGGYIIRDEDGYILFSPAQAFEGGYTRVSSKAKPLTIEELNRIGEQALEGYPATKYKPNDSLEN